MDVNEVLGADPSRRADGISEASGKNVSQS